MLGDLISSFTFCRHSVYNTSSGPPNEITCGAIMEISGLPNFELSDIKNTEYYVQ
jgi:hypothetical protein